VRCYLLRWHPLLSAHSRTMFRVDRILNHPMLSLSLSNNSSPSQHHANALLREHPQPFPYTSAAVQPIRFAFPIDRFERQFRCFRAQFTTTAR